MTRDGRKREAPARVTGPCLLLVIVVLALTLIGIVMVYSSSMVTALSEGKTTWYYVWRHVRFAVIGVVLALIVRMVPMQCWKGLSGGGRAGIVLWIVYAIAIVLLLATCIWGVGSEDESIGASRWLPVPGIGTIQPSEFAKIVFVLVAAQIMIDCRASRLSLSQSVLKLVVLVGLPLAVFVLWQESDLGTTIIIAVGILAVLWLGEVPLIVFLLILAAGVVVVLVAIFSSSYRLERFTTFLYPFSDHSDATWQLDHSLWAFSEGGIFGVGLGNSSQKYLWLPESYTDFVYAIIGEEFGLIGAVIVIVLFLLFLYAGLRIAQEATDAFGSIVAGSLTLMIVFQAFLNIGCVIGLAPTTGKTLPFVSSGGSSLLATFIMVGLMLAVSREAALPSVYERRRDDLRIVRAVDDGHGSSERRPQGRASGSARSSGSSRPPSTARSSTSTRTGRR